MGVVVISRFSGGILWPGSVSLHRCFSVFKSGCSRGVWTLGDVHHSSWAPQCGLENHSAFWIFETLMGRSQSYPMNFQCLFQTRLSQDVHPCRSWWCVTPVEIQLHWVFSPGSPVNTSLKSTQTFKQTPQVIFFCCPPVSSLWLVVSHFLTFSQAAGVYSLKITFNQHKEISLARQAPPSRGCKCVHSVLPDYGWLSKIQWSSGLLAKLLFQFGAYSHIFALWQDIHWGIFG